MGIQICCKVLTTKVVAQRLQLEAEKRKGKEGKKTQPKRLSAKAKKLTSVWEDSGATDDKEEEESEDKDDTSCVICNRLWRNYKGNKNEKWVICDICDNYCCPKCIPADTNLIDGFYCPECTAWTL